MKTSLYIPNRDGKWAIRLGDSVLQNPPGWVAGHTVVEQLQLDGDFLIGGSLRYFGASQLREVGTVLRQAWENAQGRTQYVIQVGRPKTAQTPDMRLLESLAGVVLGMKEKNHPDKDQARDQISGHLRAYRNSYRQAHHEQPDRRQMEIQRVLARWNWPQKDPAEFS